MQTDPITQRLKEHYAWTFEQYGPTVQGVDWGIDQERLDLRYEMMIGVIAPDTVGVPSLLDVGCGYGGLLAYLRSKEIAVEYTGVDVVQSMIDHAAETLPEATWVCADVFDLAPTRPFDYVVCNGILTLKLEATIYEMGVYARRLIETMFALCRQGIAFNLMSTHVNYMADNLYYCNPVEMLAWCLTTVTRRIRMDHLYPPLHEYTMYLGREHPSS